SAECVGWIAGRNDILAGLFSALAAAIFLAALGFGARSSGPGRVSPPLLAGAAPLFPPAPPPQGAAVGPPPRVPARAPRPGTAGLRGRDLIAAGIAAAAPIAVALVMRGALDPHVAGEVFAAGTLTPVQAVLWTAAFFPVHLAAPFFGSVYRLAPPVSAAFAA